MSAPERRRQPYRDFDPVEPIDVPQTLSQTALRHFERCPRSAYLYWRYQGGASSIPLERGSAFHEWADLATKTMLVAGEPEMGHEQGRELMEKVITEGEFVVPLDEQDDLYMMAYHWCEATYIDPSKIIAIEGMVVMEIGGWTVRGRIDLATAENAVAQVIDYKTRYVPKNARSSMKKFQTAFYSTGIATGSLEGAPPLTHLTHFELMEQYPRKLWEEDGQKVLAYANAVVDRDQIVAFRVYLEGIVKRVTEAFETWDFRAIPGDHCDECPCRADCPIPERLRRPTFSLEVVEIETPEQAAAVAERREFMKKQLDWEWTALKAWAAEHGPIRYGRNLELVWGEQKKTSLKDRQTLVNAVERAKVFGEDFDIDDHFRTSRSNTLSKRTLTDAELAAEAEQGDPIPEEDPDA